VNHFHVASPADAGAPGASVTASGSVPVEFAETAGDYSSATKGQCADFGGGAEFSEGSSAPVFQEYLGAWKRVESQLSR
jgi:hypothetical protein